MKKPGILGAPTSAILTKAMEACFTNGERLLDDAQMLEFQEPPARMLALSMLAQEEFAKAFLLFLVREGAISWTPYLLRAMKDHACKNLVGMVLGYLSLPNDETIEEMMSRIKDEIARGDLLPPAVTDAISMLRYEKIGRWESDSWDWTEPPNYAEITQRIAKGLNDRLKQDALYVRLGRDGHVLSTPWRVSMVTSSEEFERARSYGDFLSSLIKGRGGSSIEYEKVFGFIATIFQAAGASTA